MSNWILNLITNVRKKAEKKNGSMTLEATIAIPIFMFAILSIAFFTRVIHIQNQVQKALNQAAIEMASYSYIYHVSGLRNTHDEMKDIFNNAEGRAEERFTTAINVYTSLQKGINDIQDSTNALKNANYTEIEVYKTAYSEIEGVYRDIGDAILTGEELIQKVLEDPKAEMVSTIALLSNGGIEALKGHLGGEYARLIMNKHLDQRVFRPTNVGAYIINPGNSGIKSIDFTETSIFKDNKTIDLKVSYVVDVRLPINLVPNLNIQQRATIKGFLDGDGSYSSGVDAGQVIEEQKSEEKLENKEDLENHEEKDSIWDIGPLSRGKLIKEWELERLGYEQENYIIEVRSIDLYSNTYQEPTRTKSTLKRSIDNFIEKTNDNIDKKKIFVVVFPEDSLTPKNRKVLNEIKAYSAQNGITNFYEVEGYGKPRSATQ